MDNTVALTSQYLAPTYKRAELVLERGEGCFLYDSDNRQYLDMAAGIAVNALGYSHPALSETLAWPGLIHTSNLYHHRDSALLAQALCQNSFASKVFLCNSGTEANEAAFKFARKFGRARRYLIAFSDSFHGRTMGALAATANARYREPFEPLIGGVEFAEFNRLQSVAAKLNEHTAAVIVEPIQGEGGVRPADPGFLQGLRQLCDEAGALLIFDEVQCGVGRTGKLWAHQGYGVEPDILTVAKPLAGGLPIGAVLLNERVAGSLEPGDHGSTFGGNALVARVARRVLEEIDSPDFLTQVERRGQQLQGILESAVAKFSKVLKAQGRGLMWGLVLDATLPVTDVVEAGYRHGLILLSSGGNTLRLLPPLVIEAEDLELFALRLDAVLRELHR